MWGLSTSVSLVVLGVCVAGLVTAVAVGRGSIRGRGTSSELARASTWFVVGLVWLGMGRMTWPDPSGQEWYRDAATGFFGALASHVLQYLSLVALLMGVIRLLLGVGRRRTEAAVDAAALAEGLERVPSGSPDLVKPVLPPVVPWSTAGVGLVLVVAHLVVTGWAGDSLVVVDGRAVAPAVINLLIPIGVGALASALWFASFAWTFSWGARWGPSGGEVAGVLSLAAVLVGAAADLLMLSPSAAMVFSAENGARCDVVIEQHSRFYTASVDVLTRPHDGWLASSVLTDGPISTDWPSPFWEGGEGEVRWDDGGATVVFDASDNPGSSEAVRVDCP